jgi:ribosomal protein L22
MTPDEETTGAEPEGASEAKPAKARRLKKPSAKRAKAGAEAVAEKPAEKEPDEDKPARKASKAKAPAAKAAADQPSDDAKDASAEPPAAADAPAKDAPAKDAPAPVAKAPAPARAGDKGAPRRRVVRARARYVRTSARKARMVCVHLRGKSVQEARAILAFTPREVARDWSKLLESAVANAESNHELLQDDLIVREAYADEGPTIKRFRPRAMGRATPIRKRTSHLTITLAAGDPAPAKRKKG